MPERKAPKVKVVQVEGEEVSNEVLAGSIQCIGAALGQLLQGGVARRDLVMMIWGRAKNVGKREIENVLDGLNDLRRDYPQKK